MKKCELCSNQARMFCESDQASLCYDCDEKVHGANFLVARHSRCLFCHVCQNPTPWSASGSKLGHTVTVCENCVTNNRDHETFEDDISARNEDDLVDEHDEDEDEEDDDDEVDEDDENQVVPWSCTPPPPLSSSSGSESKSAMKRTIEDADLESDDDIGCCSSQQNFNCVSTALTLRAPGDNEIKSLRPMKQLRTPEVVDHEEIKANSVALISSLKVFRQSIVTDDNVSATVFQICKLSRDPQSS